MILVAIFHSSMYQAIHNWSYQGHISLCEQQEPSCPVAALLDYLCLRGPGYGKPLTHARLVVALRIQLKKAGINQADYCSYIFRIGAAMTAAEKGIEDSLIKALGQWKSVAHTNNTYAFRLNGWLVFQPYWPNCGDVIIITVRLNTTQYTVHMHACMHACVM